MTITGKSSPFQTKNGLAPEGGPKVIGKTVAFSATVQTVILDFLRVLDVEDFALLQAIKIDNSQNPAPLYISQSVTNETSVIKGGHQGLIPVLQAVPNMQFDSLGGVLSNGAVNVNIHFLNFMVPAAVWDSTGGLCLDHSANKPALLGSLLATANVNAQRGSLYAQNQSANPMQLVFDDGAGNNQSVILLAAGTGANAQGADYGPDYAFKYRARMFSGNAADQCLLRES